MAVGISELMYLGDPASKLVRVDSVSSQHGKQTIKMEMVVARKSQSFALEEKVGQVNQGQIGEG